MGKSDLLRVLTICAAFGLSASIASADFMDDFNGADGDPPDPSTWIVTTIQTGTFVEQDGASNLELFSAEPAFSLAAIKATDAEAVPTDPGGQFYRATFEGYSAPGAGGHRKFGFRVGDGAEAGGGKGVIHLSSVAGAVNAFVLEVGNWDVSGVAAPPPHAAFARWNTGISEEAAGDWVIEVYNNRALAYFNNVLVADTTTPHDGIDGALPGGFGWGDIVPLTPEITVYHEGINGGTASYDKISLATLPEPSTLALLGLGALVAVRRKRA